MRDDNTYPEDRDPLDDADEATDLAQEMTELAQNAMNQLAEAYTGSSKPLSRRATRERVPKREQFKRR